VWNDDPPSKLPGDTEVEIGWPTVTVAFRQNAATAVKPNDRHGRAALAFAGNRD
jgi:hypothetical protein